MAKCRQDNSGHDTRQAHDLSYTKGFNTKEHGRSRTCQWLSRLHGLDEGRIAPPERHVGNEKAKRKV